MRGNWCNFLTFCTYRFFPQPWLRYSITPLNAKVVVPQSTFLEFFLPGNTHPPFPHFFALSSCSLTLCCLACERHASKSREAKCCNKGADRQPCRKLRFLRESIGGGSKGDIYGTGAEAGKYKVFSEWRLPSFSTVRNRHGRQFLFQQTEIESNSADSIEIALKRCSKFSGIFAPFCLFLWEIPYVYEM